MLFIEQNSENQDVLKQIRKRCNEYIKVQKRAQLVLDKSKVNPQALEVAEYLWGEVMQRYTFQKDQNVLKWAKDIESIPKRFEVDYRQIMFVAQWSQEDNFWKQQIRSGGALSKHFEKLLVRIKTQIDEQEMIVA